MFIWYILCYMRFYAIHRQPVELLVRYWTVLQLYSGEIHFSVNKNMGRNILQYIFSVWNENYFFRLVTIVNSDWRENYFVLIDSNKRLLLGELGLYYLPKLSTPSTPSAKVTLLDHSLHLVKFRLHSIKAIQIPFRSQDF